MYVYVFSLYIRFLALNKKTCVARRSHLLFQFFFSLVTRMELGFTLEPPVVFYRIFIPCAILSTESSKQKLTFLLDWQLFVSLRLDLIFMICPKKISTISYSPNFLFPFVQSQVNKDWHFCLIGSFSLRCASTSFSCFARKKLVRFRIRRTSFFLHLK